MKKLSEVVKFSNIANQILKQEKEAKTREDLKLEYALSKTLKAVEPVIKGYQEKMQEKRIDLCLIDKDDSILKDEEGNFKFDKQGLKELEVFNNELLEDGCEIKTHFVSIPKGFPIVIALELEGFVFEDVESFIDAE